MTISDQILAAIEPVDAELFQLVASGPNAPTEATVAAYEAALGFALPPDFRELTLSSLGGLYVVAKPEAWPPVEEFEIAPGWKFLRGVALFGMASDIPQERLDARFQLDEARERGTTDFAPFLKLDGDAGVWGFDAKGGIRFDDGDGAVEPADEQDFAALYTREIAALIERQRRVAAGAAT